MQLIKFLDPRILLPKTEEFQRSIGTYLLLHPIPCAVFHSLHSLSITSYNKHVVGLGNSGMKELGQVPVFMKVTFWSIILSNNY